MELFSIRIQRTFQLVSTRVEIQIRIYPPPLIDFNNMNITFYSFHFADEKNFTILSYRGLI